MPWYRPRQTHPTAQHRAPFFHPLLPLAPFPHPPPPPPPPAVEPHPYTCALPPLGADSSRPPHVVGYNADAWSDHYATLSPPTPRGHRLFLQRWLPRRRPRGVVHLVHGLGDHSAKYAPLARDFVRAGYAVLAHDAHGHGRSDGLRGHADSVMDYVDDARRAIDEGNRRLPNRFGELPQLLLGHSLGGAVVIHLVSQDAAARGEGKQKRNDGFFAGRFARRAVRPAAAAPAAKPAGTGEWAGVVLTAPAVAVYPKPLLKLLAPVLATLVPLMPVQRLKFGGRRRGGRRGDEPPPDPLVVRAPVRARLGYEVLKSCEVIMREAGRFRAPVLVAHSREDRVTNAEGSQKFTRAVGSEDKTLVLYKGRVHDLLVDGENRKAIVRDVVAWTDKRVAAAVARK